MRNIVFYWAISTAVMCAGYVVYLRTLPPDDLVMANSLGFQVLVSLFVVGGSSLFVLLLVLLVRAMFGRRRSNPTLQGTRDETTRP
jgi:hypothetical protein